MWLLPFLLCLPQRPLKVDVTPYLSRESLAIRSVTGLQKIDQFGVEDLKVDLAASYDNPFDPEDITLDAEVVPPSGKPFEVPGFFERDFKHDLVDGKETLQSIAEPEWHVRICPTEHGRYTVKLRLRDKSGTTQKSTTFVATASGDSGFIRVSPRDHRYFEFDSGRSYFPIGANVCWAGPRGLYDYLDWFAAYGDQRCNYARLWLGPSWTTSALEKPGKPEEGLGMGQFDLGDAWRLDRALELARKNGLYLMLCIDSFNTLRDRDDSNYWEQTPLNQVNGGPLRIWSDFWTNSQMDRLYRAKLRYLVARYGAYTNVLSWEFWNEVDLTRDFNVDTVRAWHQRMGDALRQMDPYHHLVTTSFSDSMGVKAISQISELDYSQTHLYGSADLVAGIAYQESRKSEWGKPHYVGEIGADTQGPRTQDDPDGLQIHDPLWISIATGASGGAMPWWWDNYIAPQKLYPLFGAFSRFAEGIDFPGEDFRQTNVAIGFQHRPKTPLMRDLEFTDGPTTWSPSELNRPRTIHIRKGAVVGNRTVAGVLHGLVNHRPLHNPLRFEISSVRPTKFVVEVGEVSNHGGANLAVTLDGSRVLYREFKDPGNQAQPLRQYAGRYTVDLTRGRHVIIVNNQGADWLMANYRFQGLVRSYRPPLEAWAVMGIRTVVAWLRVSGRSWRRVAVQKQTIAPSPPSVLGFNGLAAGRWKVELWDTWAGRVIDTFETTVRNNGAVRVPLPSISRDLAVKMIRIS